MQLLTGYGLFRAMMLIFIGLHSFSSKSQELNIHEHISNDEIISLLQERKEHIYNWMSECDENSPYAGQISNSANSCVQGDVVLWSGLSCLAAHLAKDNHIIDKRCQDVSLAQGPNGRWWRGASRINVQKKNSFSRDMALGVSAYMLGEGILSGDESKKNRIKTELQRWWDFIEKEGNGKMMCDDGEDNRCRIGGSASYLFYLIGEQVGAINEVNQNYNVIKKNKKKESDLVWKIDFLTMIKPSYRVHLKAQTLFIQSLLSASSKKDFLHKAKQIYKKDRANPFYDFLYNGVSLKLVNDILTKCPVTKPRSRAAHPYIWSADWWLQSDSKIRPWEIASGHECIFMLNLFTAYYKGDLKLPGHVGFKSNQVNQTLPKSNHCEGKKQYLGEYEQKDICKPILHFSLFRYKCHNENGIIWSKDNKKYCLLGKSHYWKAR